MPINIIAPIVGLVALFLAHVFGIVLSEEDIKVIIDGIVAVGLAGMAVGGIIVKHKSKKDNSSKGE
jgi:uncharacterized protein (DUF697 family)